MSCVDFLMSDPIISVTILSLAAISIYILEARKNVKDLSRLHTAALSVLDCSRKSIFMYN